MQVERLDGTSFVGQKIMRRLTQSQTNMMKQAYQKVCQDHQFNKEEITWFNIFTNENILMKKDSEFWQQFDKFVKGLVAESESQKQNFHSYGFLYSPAKGQVTQFYHIDFDPEMVIMFVSMVQHTTQNATQFLELKTDKKPTQLGKSNHKFGDNDIELMDFLGVDSLEVKQIVCKPYTVIKGGAGTIHRGIANRSEKDRPLFWINYSKTDYKIIDLGVQSQSKRVKRESKQQ